MTWPLISPPNTHTLERKLKTASSCSTSLLTHWLRHPLMLRRPRVVLRFQVILFYLLLGCRLHYRLEQVSTVMATQPQKVQSRKSGIVSYKNVLVDNPDVTADDQVLHMKFWVFVGKSLCDLSLSCTEWDGIFVSQSSDISSFGIWAAFSLCLLIALTQVHSLSAAKTRNVDTLQQYWDDGEKLT